MNNIVALYFYLYSNRVNVEYKNGQVASFDINDFNKTAFFYGDIKFIKVEHKDNFTINVYSTYESFAKDNTTWWPSIFSDPNYTGTIATQTGGSPRTGFVPYSLPNFSKEISADYLIDEQLPIGEFSLNRCNHEYVDVGFQFTKMVCKHCDKELK